MAEINNFSEINENFDTIKTLLNSIRAQGILNTSDVDKLLGGINSKLEKINTDEDIELIKVFLTELKQSLDERHSVLVSKFGAIESLFTNLLKNSSEMLKSSEVKELFDIVATNLSVFSREVVSQKESLSDIVLRLDAIQSDDSQKKDIIKNISVLKNDIDRISNGFDSIVLSLNENFKTVIKTVSELDKADSLTEFGEQITDIVNSSNTILSALQLIDKKQVQLEDSLGNLATKADIEGAKRSIGEMSLLNKQVADSVENLTEKNYKLDNLADKIDASVNIIAGLKAVISENGEKNSLAVIDKLSEIEALLKQAESNDQFADLKERLETVLHDVINNSVLSFDTTGKEIKEHVTEQAGKVAQLVEVTSGRTLGDLNSAKSDIEEKIDDSTDRLTQLIDENITRTISDLDTNAEMINSRLNETHSVITDICRTSFADLLEGVASLKSMVSMVEDNNSSVNNAMFSNITDRLSLFENSLKTSLEKQESSVSSSSEKLIEQMSEVKNVSQTLDYKLDSSALEIGNSKKEFAELKAAVQDVLNLDFVNVVKDLKVDLYAVKKEIENSMESSSSDLTEKLANELFGKYELLVSKLDVVEEEVNRVQATSLEAIQARLEKMSSSLVDIMSYVSVKPETDTTGVDSQFQELKRLVSDNKISYVEDVRDIVDVIRIQIQNKLDSYQESVKDDIQKSYEKLAEVQTNFDEIKELLSVNKITSQNGIEGIMSSAEALKDDFETKVSNLKSVLLDRITEFKNEFSCDNADKISELKFNSENLHTKAMEEAAEMKNQLVQEIETITNSVKDSVDALSKETTNSMSMTLSKILENFVSIKAEVNTLNEKSADALKIKTDEIKAQFEELKKDFHDADAEIDEDMARQINIIEHNFQALNSLVNTLADESKTYLVEKISSEFASVSQRMDDSISVKMESYKSKLEELFNKLSSSSEKQSEFIKERVLELNNAMETAISQQQMAADTQLNDLITKFNAAMDEKIKITTEDYESLKEGLMAYLKDVESTNSAFAQELRNQLETIGNYIHSDLTVQANEINTSFEKIDENMHRVNAEMSDINKNVEQGLSAVRVSLDALLKDTTGVLDEKTQNIVEILDSSVTRFEQNSESLMTANFDDMKKALSEASVRQENLIVNKLSTAVNALEELQGGTLERFNTLKALLKDEIEPNILGIAEKMQVLFEESSVNFLTQITNSNTSITDELKANAMQLKAEFELLNERMDKDELSRLNVYNSQLNELSTVFRTLIEEAKDVTKAEVAAICETLVNNSKSVLQEVNSTFENKITKLLQTNADVSAGVLQSMETFASEIITDIDNTKQNITTCKDLISTLIKDEIKGVTKKIEKETDIIAEDVIEQFSMLKDSQKDELTMLTTQLEGSVSGYIADSVNDLKSYLDIKSDSSIMDSKIDSLRSQLDSTAETVIDNMNKLVELSVFADAISDLKTTTETLATSLADKLNSQITDFISVNVSQKLGEKLNLFDKKFIDTVVDQYEEIKLVSSGYNNSVERISQDIQKIISDFDSSKDDINTKLDRIASSISGTVDELKESFEDLKNRISKLAADDSVQLNNRLAEIENIVQEQTEYLSDINDLCCSNLPEISEMSVAVKHGIQKSLSELTARLDSQNLDVGLELNNLKTEIITQILNIFNQISFVTEQEEILDFIQEKHSELITVLSHIVTTSDGIETVKDNLASVDNKMESLKEDVELLNEKITAIMSSDGDIDYVYSLQDLESDIANLRLVLNEMKQNLNSKEDVDEFKRRFNALTEDIVSISTRTNKLILASDESNQSLQNSLQDFKLVINDLDERTKNFAHESGLDRIDNKLGAINTMMQNGAKTNQIFNQVFEYLAEWVDKAGAQISSITDKVETLDDISRIKVMLEDLKAEAEDNTESNELVEALGTVFDKQAKRISSLESKLDRIIVDTTINNKPQKLDVTPFEDTLNRFLVAIDDKIVSQQRKINSLEGKLEEIMSLVDNKDTAQLSKKVGGMDKQIAKLNKNIEKIASHVVEK